MSNTSSGCAGALLEYCPGRHLGLFDGYTIKLLVLSNNNKLIYNVPIPVFFLNKLQAPSITLQSPGRDGGFYVCLFSLFGLVFVFPQIPITLQNAQIVLQEKINAKQSS